MASPSIRREWRLFANKWKFRRRTYSHFDHAIIHRLEALALIKKFQKNGTHSFLPFLKAPIELRRFSKYLEIIRETEAGNDVQHLVVNKPRPIQCTAHQDS